MYHKLIISGGGSALLKILYVLEKISDADLLDIQEFHGTSAGSIISLLLSTGLSISSSIKIIESVDPMKMMTPHPKQFLNLWKQKGMLDNDKIGHLIDIFLKTTCKSTNITFSQHFEHTNKLYSVYATNVSKQETITFNHKLTPNFTIRDAILMSCNIPFLFKPLTYNGDSVCDGCLSCHFPVNNTSQEKTTLGIQVIPEIFSFDFQKGKNPTWFINYIYSLLISNMRETQKLIKTLCHFDIITIEHNFMNISFDMSEWKKTSYDIAQTFLEKKSFKPSTVNTD
jgi:predicted acylesterase/phospholipase RssA